MALINQSALQEARRDPAAAEGSLRRARAILGRLELEEHPTTVVCVGNLASVVFQQGRLADAEQLYDQVLPLQQRVLGADHVFAGYSHARPGQSRLAPGDPDGASAHFARAAAVLRAHDGHVPSAAEALGQQAKIALQQDRLPAARALLDDAVQLCERGVGPTHMTTLALLELLAAAHERAGDNESAAQLRREVERRRGS
jgi:tetratricopeptide (TPR) repeat protein